MFSLYKFPHIFPFQVAAKRKTNKLQVFPYVTATVNFNSFTAFVLIKFCKYDFLFI